jgi:hypothetical protein
LEKIAPCDRLPVGKYTAVAKIAFGDDGQGKPGYWVGELTTLPVEFEVAEKRTEGDPTPAGGK